MAAEEGVKPSVLILGAFVLLAVIAALIFGSSYLEQQQAAPQKIVMSAVPPAKPPPEGGELSDRIRTFFMKADVPECMDRHLGKESRVEGILEIELKPDGTVGNAEAKTEPQNGGVALCLQQLFAKGFTFEGAPQPVSYTFNARWDNGRLVLGQNVSTTRK